MGPVWLRQSEALRAVTLLLWGLWVGLFGRFDQEPKSFTGFSSLSHAEWLWSSVFMAVGALGLWAAWRGPVRARLAAGYLYMLSWSWIAGLFAAANWKSSAVPVAAMLALIGAVGVVRLSHMDEARRTWRS